MKTITIILILFINALLLQYYKYFDGIIGLLCGLTIIFQIAYLMAKIDSMEKKR